MKLIIVTGMSGAGKSTAMTALEDIGYFCVDNIPCDMLSAFARLIRETHEKQYVAVATDIRAGLTSNDLKSACDELDRLSVEYEILFLDCNEEELFLRYKQTRRLHPLMNFGIETLTKAISKEKELIFSNKELAQYVLDTTGLSYFECKSKIISMFSDDTERHLQVQCVSFGFKHGILKDADYVFDVRFLPNPYYVPELKELTGLDKEVRDYVMSSPDAAQLEEKIQALAELVINGCIKEGRARLVIGFGCTGGHHRSVTLAERLCAYLEGKGYKTITIHRDIEK